MLPEPMTKTYPRWLGRCRRLQLEAQQVGSFTVPWCNNSQEMCCSQAVTRPRITPDGMKLGRERMTDLFISEALEEEWSEWKLIRPCGWKPEMGKDMREAVEWWRHGWKHQGRATE